MSHTRRKDSGFALLLVFAMAGAIAIMLYSQMPRVAFEAQREKEELLMERGEQYIRAVQLFVSKYPRYPSNMDELEKFGGTRFLRKRYKDPMTGKDEWRILKYNAAGQLENSLVQKPEEKKENLNKFISEAPAMVATNATGTGTNLALRRRASEQQGDGSQPQNPGDASGVLGQSVNPQAATPVLPPDPNNPQAANQQVPNQQFPNPQDPNQQDPNQPIPNQPVPNQQVSNQHLPNQQFPNQQFPNQQFPNQQPGAPPNSPQWQGLNPAMAAVQGQILGGGVPPGQPNPGQQPNQQQYQQQYQQQQFQQQQYQQQQQQYQQQQFPQQQPYQPNQQPQYPQQQQQQFAQQQPFAQQQSKHMQQQPNMQQQGMGAGPGGGNAPNSAAQLIMQNLTQPRQMPGNNVPGAPGLSLGPGIAGVASTLDAPSIKVYNERQKYNEWEFVYDPKKDKRLQGRTAGAPTNNPGGPLGGNNPGGPLTNNPGGPLVGNPGGPVTGTPGGIFGPSPTGTQMPGSQTPGMPGPGMPPPGMQTPGTQTPNPRTPGSNQFPNQGPNQGTPQSGYPQPGYPQPGYPAPGRK